ncbi:hypothetical protein D3C81_1812980 [compost metagenome]
MRGLEGPGGEDDFPPGTQGANLTVLQHLDSHGASAFEQDPLHLGPGFDGQVVAHPHIRQQICARRTATFTVLLRDLIDANAFLFFTVEVVVERQTGLAGRLQKALLEWIVRT